MPHFTTNTEHLTRSDLWSTELKELFEDELFALRYVDWIDGFPDGEELNIPSIGQAEAQDYEEGQAITYSQLDTGNFRFRITEYLQSGHAITNKAKQDLFYAEQLVSSFVPAQFRAIMKRMEVDALRIGPDRQTASDPNTINDAIHRWVGTGVDADGVSDDSLSVEDFARARFALQKANVPMTNLVAIVDPSVEFKFNTLSNLTNMIYNPMWEGIVRDSIGTGMQFKVNIYGFDVYVSQNLKSGITETVGGGTYGAVTSGVANLFFSAAPDATPIVGAVRQPPKVDSKYNMDLQQEEYATTTRYGLDLYRPENMIVVLTSAAVTDPSYPA
jgi:hypothetical protein